MVHVRLVVVCLAFVCLNASGQVRVNVSTPLMPGANLNEQTRKFKSEFKRYKLDSLKTIQKHIEQIENQIATLDTADQPTDSIKSNEWQVHPDSLYGTLNRNVFMRIALEQELDSINRAKTLIKWDNVKEQYLASRMQEYLQKKGYLPPLPTTANPIEELKNSLQKDLPTRHLDPQSFKSKEALSRESSKQLNKLKSKYLKVSDIRYPEQGIEKPKPYNTFTDRLIFGGHINVTLSKKPGLDLKPNIGFVISQRMRVLVEYSADYFVRPQLTFLERDEDSPQKMGLFTDLDITRGIFMRGKVQKPLNVPLSSNTHFDYLIGVGKTLTLHKNLKAHVVLSHSFKPNERGKRWFLEYGIQQRGISNLFKKK